MNRTEFSTRLISVCLPPICLTLPVHSYAQSVDAARLFKLDSPAIVVIVGQKHGQPVSQGSGVIVSKDGAILSALHVVEGADSAVVKLRNGDVYDNVSYTAFDARKDVILLKVPGFDLPALPLGNSNDVNEGDPVAMISNPKGLEWSITQGIVSAIRDFGDLGFKVIQTTAPASPGSSGGAILNANGELIAILSFKIVGGENLNFGVPVNYARGMLGSHESFPLIQLPQPAPALPELWKSLTTNKEYRVKIDGDQLTAEWSNIPPQAAQKGAYIRSVCRRSGARWIGTSQILLSCPLPHGGTKMCPMVLRFEVDSTSPERITGGGEILKEFDCSSCQVRKTGWGPFIWVPLGQ